MKDDIQKQNIGDIQLDDEETTAPYTASDIKDSLDDAESEDLDVEEFVDTDEEGKEVGSSEKLKQLREKLKIAINEKQEYLTGWQKEKAEFVNIRRRDEESKQEFLKFATQNLLEEFIPVIDSFDMAMSNKVAWEAVSLEWRNGMEKIYNQFKAVLSKNDITELEEIGDKADPEKFQIIGVDSTTDAKLDETVSSVLQKGYMVKDKVLRPPMVRVFQK